MHTQLSQVPGEKDKHLTMFATRVFGFFLAHLYSLVGWLDVHPPPAGLDATKLEVGLPCAWCVTHDSVSQEKYVVEHLC